MNQSPTPNYLPSPLLLQAFIEEHARKAEAEASPYTQKMLPSEVEYGMIVQLRHSMHRSVTGKVENVFPMDGFLIAGAWYQMGIGWEVFAKPPVHMGDLPTHRNAVVLDALDVIWVRQSDGMWRHGPTGHVLTTEQWTNNPARRPFVELMTEAQWEVSDI